MKNLYLTLIVTIVTFCINVNVHAQVLIPGEQVDDDPNPEAKLRIPQPTAINPFGTPKGGLLIHTLSSADGGSPFAIRHLNHIESNSGIRVFELTPNGRIYAGVFDGVRPNGALNARDASGTYSTITNAASGFGSVTQSVNSQTQRIGWTSGNTSEEKKLNIGYGLANTGASGFSQSWGYNNYRSILTLDLAIDEENEHFGFVGINTENPIAPLHVLFDPSDINAEGNSGQDCFLIETTGWKTHDFALRINSHHGDIFRFSNAGELFIGRDLNLSTPGDFKLYVQDGIRAERIIVDIASENGWADYVFEDDYLLIPIDELEAFIKEHKHLPGVPSEKDVTENGIDLAEMDAVLLRHIEELTLRVIEMQKEINKLKGK
jgi:hypothetical protein